MLDGIRSEFLRYRALAEGAIAQVTDEELTASGSDGSNSIAVVCQHVAGNLLSRFTDFLESDGEKPWRDRDTEFVPRLTTRDQILEAWADGWRVLIDTLDSLDESDLTRTVALRGASLTVTDALLRALAHVSYHVGQIVYVAKAARGAAWTSLSIPPGQSREYNAALEAERRAGAATAPPGPAWKPAGYTSAAPYLIVDGAERVMAFVGEVFGARVLRRFPSPAGTVMHAEVRIGDTVVMLADGAPGWPPLPAHVHVYVPDVDATYQRALAAGGTAVQEPVKKDDDDRRGGVSGPGGITWWVATKVT